MLTFEWAYTTMAICSALRNSFLTGRVPDKAHT
jgi:arylsulfatase A-like enzyme